MERGTCIGRHIVASGSLAHPRDAAPRTLADAVTELESRMIRDALAREGSLMGAARSLDIDRNTLKRKLRGLGLR